MLTVSSFGKRYNFVAQKLIKKYPYLSVKKKINSTIMTQRKCLRSAWHY